MWIYYAVSFFSCPCLYSFWLLCSFKRVKTSCKAFVLLSVGLLYWKVFDRRGFESWTQWHQLFFYYINSINKNISAWQQSAILFLLLTFKDIVFWDIGLGEISCHMSYHFYRCLKGCHDILSTLLILIKGILHLNSIIITKSALYIV